MNSDYLKFMEEHSKQDGINLFEKVLVTAKRAKTIYEMDEEEKLELEHKPTFQAILETNEGRIRYQRQILPDAV
ncbi:MAG: DNA-directed RNA polymerase subunit omega [Deltaproteobacteria bacterium]|jgi:DNA-directed RNA polymerase subunit K/omega|nr:DNA-directed RNA polymerase subunit omega [Deltaproteobacteria bacterium]MBT7202896.1 DNA-directed RNA polymerase subunit omega [Deltaproteobacteria bacterium]